MSVDSVKVLSDVTVHMKYAKFVPVKQRRETWEEICYRNRDMHLDKYPELSAEIINLYNNYVIPKKVLPSMRSMQFAGKPIQLSPNRLYNCAYLPIDDYRAFNETMFLLLGGSGVGYSVQKKHIDKLPSITKPTRKRRYVVADSIEGWADAVKVLIKAYLKGKSEPEFDFSDIRAKGAALITTGGKAPGPAPLKECLFKLKLMLDEKPHGSKLTSLEVHDMICIIADAVLAGGIRRAALISLFDVDDQDMLTCKSGNWWELHPHRGRANNSAVVIRSKITETKFNELWDKIQTSGSGEPGIYFSNDSDWGTNPCFTGDTKLLTADGYKVMSSLKDQRFDIINHRGEVHRGHVWSNGVKSIVTVKNSLGETLRCTPDHRFMLNDGTECKAQDLRGRRIMPLVEIRTENDHYTKLGFIQGDGVLGRLDSSAHKGLEVNVGTKDQEIALMFNLDYKSDKRSYYVTGFNDELKELGFDSRNLPERELPTTFKTWTGDNKLSFLRGLYSANGSVISGKRVSFKTTCSELSLQLLESLKEFGIEAYITTNKAKPVEFSNGTYLCKESYDVNITQYNSIKSFAKLIGFVHEYKNQSLRELLVSNSPVVLSVKDSGEEEVFDFSIDDDTHWGVVGEGYIAHNCVEIALRPNQFCNLVEVNASDVVDQADLDARVRAGSFLATLQAGYTNFHYLRDIWRRNTEKDALIGVSMTGIASGSVLALDLKQASQVVVDENRRVAQLIGINPAARTTCVKPAGTTSLVLGSSSGIHAWHDQYYLRRIRVGKNEAIYKYLARTNPELLEDEFFKPDQQAVISVPVKAPEGAIFRTESPIELLERVKKFSQEWVKPGHIDGHNSHNISATISVKPDEWEVVGKWMWDNREFYNGLSVLPYDGGTYKQAPFESITKEQYEELVQKVGDIDLSQVVEMTDETDLSGEVACGGGKCEI